MPVLEIKRRNGRKPALWVDIRFNRTRIRKRSPDQTMEGARCYERLLRRTLAEQGNLDSLGPTVRPQDTTFAQFIERWQHDVVDPKGKLSGRRTKRTILRIHLVPRFGPTRLAEIDASAIDGFAADLARRGLGPKTINNVLTVLRTALRDAVRWGLLRELPPIRLERVKPPPPRFLSREEASRLVASAPDGLWRAMVLMAVTTGLRANELLALEWRDVKLSQRIAIISRGEVHGVVDTPKNGESRTVPLNHELLAALAGLRHETERVFPMPPLQEPYQHAWQRLHAISRDAGIDPPISWHVLRHTYATLSLMAGVPITAVRDIMGHSTIKTTDIYSHYAKNLLGHAADMFPRLAPGQPMDNNPAPTESGAEGRNDDAPGFVPT